MTYKEYYLTLETVEDIEAAANTDVTLAYIINPDRVAVILKQAQEAIDEKFNKNHETSM